MEQTSMKDDLHQEYTQFKIVAGMKCKQTDSEHEKAMIMHRLDMLRQRFEEYSDKGYDLEHVRVLEKKLLNELIAINKGFGSKG
jgi:hypothetical protein